MSESDLRRPLAGCVANISVSESDDSESFGFPPQQVNRVTLQIVSALFGQGVTVVFGHDWRDDGVMEAVYGFARQMQPPFPLTNSRSDTKVQPLLLNLLPWPDNPYLQLKDLERLSSTLLVRSAGLPEELRQFGDQAHQAGRDSPLYRYIRARALTFLRQKLDKMSHVRLCLGGRRSGSAGRYPGVIEEAVLALRSHKPLYLAGLLGGATQQVIDAIDGKAMPDDFCSSISVAELYKNPPIQDTDRASSEDRVIDREGVWAEFANGGRARISKSNLLTLEENEELLHARAIDRVIELVLIGMSRLRPYLPKPQLDGE